MSSKFVLFCLGLGAAVALAVSAVTAATTKMTEASS